MNLQKLLTKLLFGEPVKGERVKKDYELKHSVTYPHGGARQSEAEWKKEFKVSSQYSRFNPTGKWYDDETPEEYSDMLKRVLTGSL